MDISSLAPRPRKSSYYLLSGIAPFDTYPLLQCFPSSKSQPSLELLENSPGIMTMATDCTALVTKLNDGKSSLVKTNIARPSPGPHQVLVRVSHVAQNPTDGMQNSRVLHALPCLDTLC